MYIYLNEFEKLRIWPSATMCNIYMNILENLITRVCLPPPCNIYLNEFWELRIWTSATMCNIYINISENLIMRICLLPPHLILIHVLLTDHRQHLTYFYKNSAKTLTLTFNWGLRGALTLLLITYHNHIIYYAQKREEEEAGALCLCPITIWFSHPAFCFFGNNVLCSIVSAVSY
jgi:hypothetical protein